MNSPFTRRPWRHVLEDLRGHRLAVYDDVMQGRTLPPDLPGDPTTESLCWLVYHRLVILEGGQLRAQQPPHAEALYNQHGAAGIEAGCVARWRTGVAEPTPEPAGPNLQLEPTRERWRNPKPTEPEDQPRAPVADPNQGALPL